MKRIFISAGHDSKDPGAVANGKKEAEVALEFRDLVAHYLEAAGASFAMDGAKGDNRPLREAVKLIRPGDIAVEFHLNAAASPEATGVETLSADKNKVLGAAICEAISGTLKIRNRGAKGESSGQHSKLAFVQAGGVIVELFFVTNKSDLATYEAFKWVVAKNVAAALLEHAGGMVNPK